MYLLCFAAAPSTSVYIDFARQPHFGTVVFTLLRLEPFSPVNIDPARQPHSEPIRVYFALLRTLLHTVSINFARQPRFEPVCVCVYFASLDPLHL